LAGGQDNILNVSGTFAETMRQIYLGVRTLSEGGRSSFLINVDI